jgi:Uma2 family endonuclease
MLPEGTLAEVIDNTLYMSPAPNPFHQEISINLSSYLNVYVLENKLGKVFEAPIDLYLDEESDAVQPDILFISKGNSLRIDREGLHGSPDLIIEILSPGNKNHDLVKKKDLYEKFGVKEYWIVDPETKLAIGYILHGKSYVKIGESEGEIRSSILNKAFIY